MDLTRASPEAAFLSTGGYHHHLAANTWQSAGAGPRDPRRAGLASVTLEAASPSVLAAIVSRGAAPDLADAGLHDPWGTALQFTLPNHEGQHP